MKKALKRCSSILLTLLMLVSMLPVLSLPVFAAEEGDAPESVVQEPAPEADAPQETPPEEPAEEAPASEDAPLEEAAEDEALAVAEGEPTGEGEPAPEVAVASAAEDDTSIGKVDTNVLSEMNFNTNTEEVEALMEQDIAPYGTGTTALHTISELFVSAGWRDNLWDNNSGTTWNNNKAAVFNYEGLDAGALMTDTQNKGVVDYTDSYSKLTSLGFFCADTSASTGTANTGPRVLAGEYDFIRSAAFDPNGVGRNTHVAQVCAKVESATKSTLYIRVLDLDGKRVSMDRELGTLPFRLFASSAGAYLSIAAGDFDSDGNDEFAVYVPLTSNKESQLHIYKMEKRTAAYYAIAGANVSVFTGGTLVPMVSKYLDVASTAATYGMKFDGLGTSATGTQAMKELPVVAITASRQSEDLDGADDLVFTISYTRDVDTRSFGTPVQANGLSEGLVTAANSDNQSAASRVLTWIDPLKSSAVVKPVEGMQSNTSAFTFRWSDYGTKDNNSNNPMYEVGMFAGVGTGDLDNDSVDEVIVASYRLENSNINENSFNCSTTDMMVSYLEYTHASKSYKLAQKPNWVSFHKSVWSNTILLSDGLYNDDRTQPYLTWEPPEVQGFAARGNNHADSALVNGIVVALDSQTSYGHNGLDGRAYPDSIYPGYPTSVRMHAGLPVSYTTFASDTLTILDEEADLITALYALPLKRMDDNSDGETGRVLAEAVAGNFDNNPNGCEQLAVTYIQKLTGENHFRSFIGMMGIVDPEADVSFTASANNNAFFAWNRAAGDSGPFKVSAPVTVAAVDIDSDSLVVRYVDGRSPDYYFSDPKPIILMQAAPYFDELGEAGSTQYGSQKGFGTALNNEVNIGGSVSVGIEFEAQALFVKLGGVKVMASASVSAGYTNEASTEVTTFKAYEATDEDTIVLAMTPYVRYYYEMYNGDSEKWLPMVVDYPMDSRVTSLSVDTYDAMAEIQGWQTIRGGAMTHTPGDPSTYPSSRPGWTSAGGWTDTGTASETKGESRRDAQSHGVTWGAGVSTEVETNTASVTVGVSASVDYTGGYTWTNFTGIEYSGTVPGIPSKYSGYSFSWDFGWYRTKLTTVQPDNPVSVVVLGYLVRNVKALPKPPSNLHVKAATDHTVTLGWSEAGGKVPPDYYTAKNLRSNASYNVGMLAAKSDTGLYSITDTEAAPNLELMYSVASSAYMNNRLVSGPDSTPVKVLTSDSKLLYYTTHPRDTHVNVGDDLSLSVKVADKTGGKGLTYEWQTYSVKDGWVKIMDVNKPTLNLGLATPAMNGSVYRCLTTSREDGLIIAAYSNSATVTVGKHEVKLSAAFERKGASVASQGRASTSAAAKDGDPMYYSIALNATDSSVPTPTGMVTVRILNTTSNVAETIKVPYEPTGTNAAGERTMDCVWYPAQRGVYKVSVEYHGGSQSRYTTASHTASGTYNAYPGDGSYSLYIARGGTMTYGEKERLDLEMRSRDAGGATSTVQVLAENVTFSVIREGENDANGVPVQKTELITPHDSYPRCVNFTPDKAGRYHITATYVHGGQTYTASTIMNVERYEVRTYFSSSSVKTCTLAQVTGKSINELNNMFIPDPFIHIVGTFKYRDEIKAAIKATLNITSANGDLDVGVYTVTPYLDIDANSDLMKDLNDRYTFTYNTHTFTVTTNEPTMARLIYGAGGGKGGVVTATIGGIPVASGEKVPVEEATFYAVPDKGYTLRGWVGATQDKNDPLKATAQVASDGSTVVQALFTKAGTGNAVTGVEVTADFTEMYRENSYQFKATVSMVGATTDLVKWEVLGAKRSGTTINDDGLLTVDRLEELGVLTIRATTVGTPVHVGTLSVPVACAPGPAYMHVLPYTTTANPGLIKRGGTQQMNAVVFGAGDFDRGVTWELSQVSSQTIDQNGLITASADASIGGSPSLVLATSVADDSIKEIRHFTVAENVDPAVSQFLIYPELDNDIEARLPTAYPGNTVQFKSLIGAVGGYDPASAIVDWSVRSGSDSATISSGTTIDSSGLLTIAEDETAPSLSVTGTLRGTTTTASAGVKVLQPLGSVTGVSIAPEKEELAGGESATFAAAVDVREGLSTAVTWAVKGATSADTTLVPSGNSATLTLGQDEEAPSVLVVATSVQEPGQYATARVKVTGNTLHSGVLAVTVSPTPANVGKGKTRAFTAEVLAEEGVSTDVTWSVIGQNSSSTSISDEGVLTVSAGETAETLTVRATSQANPEIFGDADITVTDMLELSGVSLYPATARLTQNSGRRVTLRPSAGAEIPENAVIEWSVDEEGATFVDLAPDSDGKAAYLLAKAHGSATITATVKIDGKTFTAPCAVTVYIPIEDFTLNHTAYTLAPGEPPLGLMAGFSPEGAGTGVSVLWSSSNRSVASVNQIGEVTAHKPGTAVITATTDDNAFTASCVVTVGRPQGSLEASAASLLLEKGDASAAITVTASEGLGEISAKMFKADGKTEFEKDAEVITVSPASNGAFAVTPLAVGTAYIHFIAEKNPDITAVCRVDVYEKPGEGAQATYAKRHLETTAATVYNRNLQRAITLPLRSDGSGTPWLMADASGYAFTGANKDLLSSAYTIEAGADGQSLKLVPNSGLEAIKPKKYTAGIEVTLPGSSEAQPLISGTLSLTVVDSLPKLSAQAVSVNSFLADLTRDIVINGAEGFAYTLAENAKKTAANAKLTWLDVDLAGETLTVEAGTSKRGSTYYLAVELDETVWGDDAVVNVPLKVNVTYTPPALKLASTKVTMYAGLEDNTGARLTLTPKATNATLPGMGVNGVQVIPSGELTDKEAKTYKNQDAFKATGFNRATGAFMLEPVPSDDLTAVPKGKVLLGATVNGGGYAMRLPVTVSVVKPGSAIRLTANTASVTLNQLLSPAQSATFELGTSAQGYYVNWESGVSWQLKRGKTDVGKLGELDVIQDGNLVMVATTGLTKPGATYKLTVTKDKLYTSRKGDEKGTINLTVKTVKTSAKVGASFSVKEKVDLTTGAYAVLTAKFTNYRNGFVDAPVFKAKTMPKGVDGEITDYFDFVPLDSAGTRWAITARDVPVTPGAYSITATGKLNTGESLEITKAVKFTVTATKPKVTLAAKKVTMYSTDQHSTVSVGLTLPAGTPPVEKVKIKNAAHDSMYDVNLRGGKLMISFDQDEFSVSKLKNATLVLEIYLEGNAKAATTVKLGVTVKKFK